MRKPVFCYVLITAIFFFLSRSAHPQAPAHPGLAKTPRAAASAQQQYKAIFEPVNYPQDVNLKDVFFTSADEGWVAGEHATILHTADGGKSWKAQVGGDPSNQEQQIKLIRFLDAKHGWAIEDSPERILATTDGQNWSELGPSPRGVQDFLFSSVQHGILLANGSREYYRGGVFLTEDFGKTWKPQIECKMTTTVQGLAHNDECWFISLRVLSSHSAYALAADNSNSLALFHTEDDGVSWNYRVLPFQGGREEDFAVPDPQTALVVFHGDGKTYLTTDGGESWHVLLATTLADQIHFADPEVGWTLGSNPSNWRAARVSYTTDGGRHWKASGDLNFPPKDPSQYRFNFPRRDRAYVIGPHGMVYRYRIVPATFTAPGILDAPIMPAAAEEH